MFRVMFVCHGNICRSPMAEFVFRDIVSENGMTGSFTVASAATSREEIGNPVHPGTQKKLRTLGISTDGKYSVQLRREDYEKHDYFLGMDKWNIRNMCRIFERDCGTKIRMLMDLTTRPREIADPWYTGDFDTAYADIREGCEALFEYLTREKHR